MSCKYLVLFFWIVVEMQNNYFLFNKSGKEPNPDEMHLQDFWVKATLKDI